MSGALISTGGIGDGAPAAFGVRRRSRARPGERNHQYGTIKANFDLHTLLNVMNSVEFVAAGPSLKQ
jgi:hypothetical protein